MTTSDFTPNSDSITTEIVEGIPVAFSAPRLVTSETRLAIWLPFLGGSKENTYPTLKTLSARGFFAVSLDPWHSGDRTKGSRNELMSEAMGHFRKEMWEILGHTTLDAFQIIDLVISTHGPFSDVRAGGISMGGDIAVALAGIDKRVSKVAAIVATPDWARPGMTHVGEPDREIVQGESTPHSQWLYDALNPMSNLHRYAHAPLINFELGTVDTHVPPAGAIAFRSELQASFPVAAEAITITLHDGLDHLEAARNPNVLDRAIDWLSS